MGPNDTSKRKAYGGLAALIYGDRSAERQDEVELQESRDKAMKSVRGTIDAANCLIRSLDELRAKLKEAP